MNAHQRRERWMNWKLAVAVVLLGPTLLVRGNATAQTTPQPQLVRCPAQVQIITADRDVWGDTGPPRYASFRGASVRWASNGGTGWQALDCTYVIGDVVVA